MFWDSSALVPLLIEEPRSLDAQSLLKGSLILVSWFTRVEIGSALTRLWRVQKTDEAGLQSDLAERATLASCWIEIPPRDDLRHTARGCRAARRVPRAELMGDPMKRATRIANLNNPPPSTLHPET